MIFSANNNTLFTAVTTTRIGRDMADYGQITGLMDDICIIKGKALWTENFTPPTTYLPDKL